MEEFSSDIKGAGAAGARACTHRRARQVGPSLCADVDGSRSVQASAFFLGKEALEDGKQTEIELPNVECLFVVASGK